jgi:hypothetical protein
MIEDKSEYSLFIFKNFQSNTSTFTMNRIVIIILTLFFFFFKINAQDLSENTWTKKLDDWNIKPVIGFQVWSTYTFGAELFNEETGQYDRVDNRLNTLLRRSRLGVIGQPYPNLKFAFVAALDLVGKDNLAGTEGPGNNGASPFFRAWNAQLEWRITNKNDWFHLTGGYMPFLMGREGITPALRVSSMEKAWSQNYLRRHLVGTGPGRALGLNLGGLFLNSSLGVSYDIGIYNPVFASFGGNSTGANFSPLVSGRFAFHFGDPEFEKYTNSHKENYFGKRKGLTLAFTVARQGSTDLFTNNFAYGIDWLFNWGNIHIIGDWSILERNGEIISNNNMVEDISSDSNTGFVRIGYNIELKNSKILEPVLMLVQFNGELDGAKQTEANILNAFAGKDQSIEASLNLYLNPDLKLSLSYTFREGELGDAGPGARFNNYYFQGGLGAIQRGEWLGVGLVAIF